MSTPFKLTGSAQYHFIVIIIVDGVEHTVHIVMCSH